MLIHNLVFLACQLTTTAATIYSGFNVGAWTATGKPKTYKDFRNIFQAAKDLPGTNGRFNSARLFQTPQGPSNQPSEAFRAAVDSGTTLLAGIWLYGPKNEPARQAALEKELKALEMAFTEHGKELADLVVGLSVGSEDVLRGDYTKEDVTAIVGTVRDRIAKSSYADLWGKKPIGHLDTASSLVVDGLDFVGVSIYPYWDNSSIENAEKSFYRTLDGVKKRAGEKPVWIMETGWPHSAQDRLHAVTGEVAVGSQANMQRYWKTTGCSLFGKMNTWWFESEFDSSDPGNPDWAVIDPDSRKVRIDLTCTGQNASLTAPNSTFPSKMLPKRSGESMSLIASPASSSILQNPDVPSSLPTGTPTEIAPAVPDPSATVSGDTTAWVTVYQHVTVYEPRDDATATLTDRASNDAPRAAVKARRKRYMTSAAA